MATSNSTNNGPNASDAYAGDISAEQAWDMLRQNQSAVLVDVRTKAEWSFVGIPDLSELDKDVILIEWQNFPSMARNAAFESELSAALEDKGVGEESPILFLCRSGARSRSAAITTTAMGHTACFNVAGGFEGDLDATRHRSTQNGWRHGGLPWVQS